MLVVGYTTSNISTGAYVSGPYVKIYKNTGTAPYYNETDVITNIPAWVNTNWAASNAVRQYTGNFAAWSKKDSKILVTGSDGTNKYSKLFKPDGLGGYAEIVNPVGGTTPFEGVIGYCGFGDFDADGDDDILLYDTGLNTSTRALGYARVYRNDGADNYTLMTLNMPYTVQNFYSIAISDTNGDGRDDIAINGVYNLTSNTAANYRTALYTPDASMAFTEVIPKVAAANIRQIAYGAVAFIDTDGDGVASDIVMAGGQGNTTSARRFTLYKRNAAVPLTDDNAYTVEFDYATTDGAFNAVGFQYGMIAVGDLSGTGKMKDFVSIGQRNSNSNRPYVGIKRTSGYTIYNNLEVTTNAAISSYNGNTAPNTSFFGNIINGGGSSVLRAYAIGDVDADGKADDLATFALEYFGAASLKVSSTLYVNDETVNSDNRPRVYRKSSK
ncbi:FG-GAP-like repeat-containing protein [Pedobacter sp. SL55]|uniref:FG-GAP-like repeat-containing protein n=1 Tax=Pedobacter sp. SL55 TaxID=2995161 RepID=UPI002270B364|nr:FG-GAP-like repeat-containing protein [Pedobacter sp. SL55]WAC41295.1 FG-GAP-like repeat-containing protein [Pedobacter sp. SL55]